MIGVDTNILVRSVTGDDPRQTPVARRFLNQRKADDPAVVNLVVMAEFVWTMRTKYSADRDELIKLLDNIIGNDGFHILHREPVLIALQDYRDGIGSFTDVLIAQLNAEVGCATTMTFDKKASTQSGFTRLA